MANIAELRSKVNQVMPVGFGWDHIMATGIVTRMDLAIDVANVQIDDILFAHGKTQITEVNTKSGRTEYLGGKYKSGKVVALYDKTAQIRASNAKAVYSKDKEPVPDFPVTRLEIRLDRNLYGFKNMLVSQLSQLKNPFPNLTVASINHKDDIALEAWVWEVFLRLARFEGAHAALFAFPPPHRPEIMARMRNARPAWWMPDHFWLGYPSLVERVRGKKSTNNLLNPKSKPNLQSIAIQQKKQGFNLCVL